MSLSETFIPIHIEDELNVKNYSSDCWINRVTIHDKSFPTLDGKKIALIGIVSENSSFEANHVRNYLYSMTKIEYASVSKRFKAPESYILKIQTKFSPMMSIK